MAESTSQAQEVAKVAPVDATQESLYRSVCETPVVGSS